MFRWVECVFRILFLERGLDIRYRFPFPFRFPLLLWTVDEHLSLLLGICRFVRSVFCVHVYCGRGARVGRRKLNTVQRKGRTVVGFVNIWWG